MPLAYRHYGLGPYLRYFFYFWDLLVFNALFAVSIALSGIGHVASINTMWLLVNLSFLAVILRKGSDKSRDRAIRLDHVFADSLADIGVHALFFLSLCELTATVTIPITFYLIYYGSLFVLLPLSNTLLRRWVKSYRRRGFNYLRVVIVGTNRTSERMHEALDSDTGFGYRLLGFFDSNMRPQFRYSDLYVGSVDMLADFVLQNKVDQIYYTIPEPDSEEMQKVVKIADDTGTEFFYVPHVKSALGRGFSLQSIGAMSVLAGRSNPLKNPLNRGVKRAFDLVFSSIFLVTLYPIIYVVVAIGIKMTSPGPVYFRQQRTGYKGKSFNCLKFRTMRVNAQADNTQATPDDPRKTRFGDFLRRTSLDEIPQFINVWRGEMSVIGPRPHMLKHTEEYSKLVDRYMVRHIVKPGITGWAQVNGLRGITDQLWKMERRVEFDVWYIENWSFLLDMKIVVRTIINALHHDNNAF